MTGSVAPEVRLAAPIDVTGIVDALQSAFYDDPVMAFLFPRDHDRRWRLAKFFEVELKGHHLPLGSVWTTADVRGAALWSPPGHWQLPPAELARNFAPLLRAFGWRLPKALRTLATVERQHPQEPHWYLAVLGTASAFQGQGVGSALMAPVLQRCDTEGLPAYLESSKQTNIAFYTRHGFEVTGEIRLPNGPTVWPMWRSPRS